MHRHRRIVAGYGGGHGGEDDDGRDKGEDYAGREAREEVADVAEGTSMLLPLLVVVEGAALPHPPLLDRVGPIGDCVEEGG